jgi:hypothetical protein
VNGNSLSYKVLEIRNGKHTHIIQPNNYKIFSIQHNTAAHVTWDIKKKTTNNNHIINHITFFFITLTKE